jgi:hypothetical protein
MVAAKFQDDTSRIHRVTNEKGRASLHFISNADRHKKWVPFKIPPPKAREWTDWFETWMKCSEYVPLRVRIFKICLVHIYYDMVPPKVQTISGFQIIPY